jgi:SAM-dependent methyltransferase
MTRAIENLFYYLAGIVFLTLAKLKHTLRGYSTPKPFSLREVDRCIEYDVNVAENWFKNRAVVAGKHVLELGPGSDMGVGLYLLAKGAARYTAFDRHDLVSSVPRQFYDRFREKYAVPDLDEVTRTGRLAYMADANFDLGRSLPSNSIDIVVSNAAFEHFDNVEKVVADLTRTVKTGGTICAVIDLQTHSRWIRDKDPNNIYRYPEWLYRAFYFPGQPNRIRPSRYCEIFRSHGWTEVRAEPAATFRINGRRVHQAFAADSNLDWLSMVLTATRS